MSGLSALLGGQAARISIRFADADTRETINVRLPDGRDEEQYLFGAADNICGTVRAAQRPMQRAACAARAAAQTRDRAPATLGGAGGS